MKFTEDMIGKRVREKGIYGTFDEGVINRCGRSDATAWVDLTSGEYAGRCLLISLDELDFINESNTHHPESIVIDGVKYRLVRED